MLSYFRLIRLPNLLIIAFSQLLIRYCLILPAFKAEYFITGVFPQHLSDINFFLLVFSSLLLAAGGYIINDYFDIQIDEINRPNSNIIGKRISKANAKTTFFIVSIIGICIGFYLSTIIERPSFGLIHLFTAVSLWMYSSFYKKRLLSGNIIVAILCALSLFVVGLYEPEFYRNIHYLIWYAVLAFLTTIIREIIKDTEDINGDKMLQCKTLPIFLGIPKTKIIIQILILLTITYVAFVLRNNFYGNRILNFWYLLSFFVIPFAALSFLVFTANEKKDFYYAGLYSKILMVAGVLTILPFWYYFIR